jgi:hypothetical protein
MDRSSTAGCYEISTGNKQEHRVTIEDLLNCNVETGTGDGVFYTVKPLFDELLGD